MAEHAQPVPSRKRGWGALCVLAGILLLIATLGTVYFATQHTVAIEINGVRLLYRTHQRSPQGVLRELGLVLNTEDLIEFPDELPSADAPIRVTLARTALLTHDGSVTRLRTHATTVGHLLGEMGVVVYPYDRVWLSGNPCDLEAPLPSIETPARPAFATLMAEIRRPIRLNLRRAVTLTVQDGALHSDLYTTARTLGEALYENGVMIYAGDRVSPDLNTEITPGLIVSIERSKPVVVDMAGERQMVRTRTKTVGALLEAMDLDLNPKDRIEPDASTELQRDMQITVTQIRDEYFVEEEPIPYEVRREPDPELEIDNERVAHWGREGARRRRYRVHYENGQEMYRVEVEDWVAHEPIDRIINYGTKIVLRELETPNGTVTYWRKIRVLVTSYNAPTAGKPPDHPTYGITRLGWKARKGIIAVDPRVIPLLQNIYVPGYGVGVAGDTGSAIQWKHIDLCYDDHNLVHWYRWEDIYLLTPVPDRSTIAWTIPDLPQERR
jgi:uncharacterized protein YabE (DUF348 family)